MDKTREQWVPPLTTYKLVRLDFTKFLSLLSLIIFIKKCNKVKKLCKRQFHKTSTSSPVRFRLSLEESNPAAVGTGAG